MELLHFFGVRGLPSNWDAREKGCCIAFERVGYLCRRSTSASAACTGV